MMTEFEVPSSDELPDEFSHHGQPHAHRHTEGFPAHSHAAAGDEAAEDDGMRLEGHGTDTADADARYQLQQSDHMASIASGFADVLRAHGYSVTTHPDRPEGKLATASHPDRSTMGVYATYE